MKSQLFQNSLGSCLKEIREWAVRNKVSVEDAVNYALHQRAAASSEYSSRVLHDDIVRTTVDPDSRDAEVWVAYAAAQRAMTNDFLTSINTLKTSKVAAADIERSWPDASWVTYPRRVRRRTSTRSGGSSVSGTRSGW